MKIKILSAIVAVSAALTCASNAVSVTLAGITNDSVGLITLSGSAVSGSAYFISTTNTLTGVSASMETLLASADSTLAQFDAALAGLIGPTSSTSPGIVRNVAFTNGLLSTSAAQEMGDIANKTYLFLVAENAGFISGIGAYTGANVPAGGAVIFNPTTAGDSLGVGTSVFAAGTPNSGFQLAAAVPEPSAALLGALGALGLLRRRRA